jgi:hypothetical protein
MKHKTCAYLLFVLLFTAALIGCSDGEHQPVIPPDSPADAVEHSGEASERHLWGIWNLGFDASEMTVVAVPARELLAHYNIT